MHTNSWVAGIVCLAIAQQTPAETAPPAWVNEGPYADERSLFIELPMDVLATKLFVEVELGGHPRRFVFDTGSPSMVSADLAAELGLDIIDTRQGRDAHGAIIETNIAQTDLTLGEVTFHKVPVYIAEFPEAAQCLFDGVLGSEVLPLCAWQMDVPDAMLRCAAKVSELDSIATARQQTLYDFGYPHTPFFDIQLSEQASSKAMFDTGSSEYLTLSPMDRDGAARDGGIGRTVSGSGSLGQSLGGAAPVTRLQSVRLNEVSVGSIELGAVDAPVRSLAPSLIGASLLNHFVVTLDARANTAYFDAYEPGPFQRGTFGFGLQFDGDVTVSQVWADSPADAAGMAVGDRVTSINDKAVTASCEDMRHTMRLMADAEQLDVEWEGSRQTLTRTR
ncbi:aspartyl protease family protein [Saccharospirillum impatiens]|uniref:aspartyl protease family protein n=1 Tax=Saccharospirillum impatiens TaxID=169438 RepID=UPI0003FA2297|nr:aspartyl protease family protein [Saccharospirillum impatiens]